MALDAVEELSDDSDVRDEWSEPNDDVRDAAECEGCGSVGIRGALSRW